MQFYRLRCSLVVLCKMFLALSVLVNKNLGLILGLDLESHSVGLGPGLEKKILVLE